MRALLGRVAQVRPNGPEGFDVVVGGRDRQADWDAERAQIRAVADAGATWWNEWVKPADRTTTEAAISRGALRD